MKLSEWQRLLRNPTPEASPKPKEGLRSTFGRFGLAIEAARPERRWIEKAILMSRFGTLEATSEFKDIMASLGWPDSAKLMWNENRDILEDVTTFLFYINNAGDVSQILPAHFAWEPDKDVPILVLSIPEPADSAIKGLTGEASDGRKLVDALVHDAINFGAWPRDTQAVELSAITASDLITGCLESRSPTLFKRPFTMQKVAKPGDLVPSHLEVKWDHYPGARLSLGAADLTRCGLGR